MPPFPALVLLATLTAVRAGAATGVAVLEPGPRTALVAALELVAFLGALVLVAQPRPEVRPWPSL